MSSIRTDKGTQNEHFVFEIQEQESDTIPIYDLIFFLLSIFHSLTQLIK